MQFILAAGIGVCAFMLLQLWQKNERMGQAKFLAMAIQALWIIRFGIFYAKIIDLEAVTAPLVIYDQVLLFLDGPLIWLYTRSLVEPKRFKGKVWVHFIPFFLMFAYATYQLIAFPRQLIQLFHDTWQAFQDGTSTAGGIGFIVIAAIVYMNIVYMFRSLKVARAYNVALEEEYSNTDRLTADWIIRFQKLWVILFVFPLVLYFANYIWPIFPMMELAGAALVAIVLLSIVFNMNLLKQVYVTLPLSKSKKPPVKKPAPSGFEKELNRLTKVLKEDKAYLDESLTLSQLADSLDIKPAELTDLIKVSEYENFYDLINSHRIEEVKAQLLQSNEQVIQIAYQSGFKSKSTFNKIFKEKTGLTPKAYRNS